jgi:hypothetical protein
MVPRIVAASCALGVALIAGCSLYVGDPEPSDPPSDPPPSDPPPSDPPPSDPPPSDPPPSDPPSDPPPPQPGPWPVPPDPLPPPPPSLGVNVPSDAYDPANHRLLVPDCENGALLSLDLFTGERSVLIDDWHRTEPVDVSCVLDVVIEQTGEHAFATVLSTYREPGGGDDADCLAIDLVAIDTEARAVTLLQNVDTRCCEECGNRGYFAMQVDDAQQRLLHAESDCSGDDCNYHVSTAPREPGDSQRLHWVPTCPPYESGCSPDDKWMAVRGMRFDPAAPDQRLLLLTRHDLEYRIDSFDVATGAITHVVDIDPVPENMWISSLSVDVEKQRVLLTGFATSPLSHQHWMVIAVDLVTGEQSVLYDGHPGADGPEFTCSVEAAFDSRLRRLLLFETHDYYYSWDCAERVFALDPDTGALTFLSNDSVR